MSQVPPPSEKLPAHAPPAPTRRRRWLSTLVVLSLGLGAGLVVPDWLNPSPQLHQSLPGRHLGPVAALAFQPGTNLLTVGRGSEPEEAAIRLWDLEAGRIRGIVPDWSARVGLLAFSPDGQRLAIADNTFSGWVGIWETNGGQRLRRWQAGGAIGGMAFSPNGLHLFVTSGFEHQKLGCWDVRTGERVFVLPRCVAFALAPDGKTLASAADRESDIRLHASADGTELRRMAGAFEPFAFSPDGAVLAAHDKHDKGGVRLYDVATGRPLPVRAEIRRPRGLTFSPDGALVAVAEDDSQSPLDRPSGWVHFIAVADGQVTTQARLDEYPSHRAFSKDGRWFVVAGGRMAWLYDVPSRRLAARLRQAAGAITATVFSPDSQFLVIGDHAGAVRIWRLPS